MSVLGVWSFMKVCAPLSMALTLHQSGHGHSHGGLGSKGHSHKTPERSSETCNGAVDAEQDAATGPCSEC